ncbi:MULTISPECIES: DEAD/DEAH box helicase [Stenotrophomonas]|jgi:type III restriction enzyme|uniref:DEAD/DEAH box helicase family protein n=3 Tax=Gammaproteobacteria TaxID=1236 RepID=A0A8E3U8U2_STEMA|nr:MULTISPECIES: DEAD/DEAH box helicase family protein [Stenotrophomonas]MCV4211465.1 DEAD/DEAH box helicase family protein [Pseudomonas cichorii]MBA0435109.1 type III restriction endonuclease subunit R [Stenotrophomonas maltophilia]MBH1408585.1 DEAD/DEAH box helicase family protein [Stenotrophomonas maltophilia]MBH1790752.1 DEAD/DEAH box helicase family protein [Stenotrophomonas maltophilia]MCA0091760.1 DEAD/DEAH box helicase family protein [Stenotrophomonas maltophilia]
MALSLKVYQQRALSSLAQFLEDARLSGPESAFERNVDPGLVTNYKPMPGMEATPYVCLRIPTGGGKTVMGAHIIQAAGDTYLERTYPLVMWMVPTTQIKTQTLEAFKDPRHPYRQELDEAFGGKVAVFDVEDFTHIRPADLGTKVCVVISTMAALRVENQDGRKVYEHHEDLETHFAGSVSDLPYLEQNAAGKAIASFANLLKLHGPLVITDEAHNANTPLSYEVYQRLGAKLVVELTATPEASKSNVLVSVSAFELKVANMIKFPVVLKEHVGQWEAAVGSAVARRNELGKTALNEQPDYIRPILLIQAENAKGTATVEEVNRHLIDIEKVPENAIAIATGDQREIDGVDLFAKDCPIEVIITKQALKEGWDCSFAYVFCSVAQVKSDKDIQQLLGRVLRMPYATRRKQEAMNKAYAHVTTTHFNVAAAELTKSLIDIGFNPLEAVGAVQREPTPGPGLGLQGGANPVPTPPKTTVAVSKPPDLTNVPERDQGNVVFVPYGEGKGGTVEITGEVDDSTVEAITLAAPAKEREEVAATIERHQIASKAVKAPSQNGAVFSVPRLCVMEQGELEFIESGAVPPGFMWDLLAYPPDLSSLKFNADSQTFEVDLVDEKVTYTKIDDDVNTYLPGFAKDRTEADLVGWLDQKIRDPAVKQPVLREWVRRAISGLSQDRGFSLSQLLNGQFVLRRKLSEQLQLAKVEALKDGFQQALFGDAAEVVVSDEPDAMFTYPADMTLYPAHSYYQGGTYRFRKHYYPFVGDLQWKTAGGKVGEEFLCAQAIDQLDEVEFWVRNLVDRSQFWMPTAKQRTYPDFVARLKDGRLLVVEYKGGDRYSSDTEKEKRMVGELWATKSKGKGIYLMAQLKDEKGNSVTEQLKAAIGA